MSDPLGGGVPATRSSVVIQECVQRNREVSVCRLANLAQLSSGAVGIQHLAEHFDTCAVTKQLARREQVAPQEHPVALWFAGLVAIGNALARNHFKRLPLGQFLVQPRPDFSPVVVFRARGSEVPHPSIAARFAGFQRRPMAPLVDHREQLLTHAAVAGLTLDLVTVDHPSAVAVGANPVAPRHGTR